MDYFINYDITYYLLEFLSLSQTIHLMILNSSFHQLVQITPLFKELTVLKTKKNYTLQSIIQSNLLVILKKQHAHQSMFWNSIRRETLAVHLIHWDVLDWLQSVGYFGCNDYLIDWAAANNQLTVLNWFVAGNWPVRYTNHAIYEAARNNHVAVLDWFQSNNYPLRDTNTPIICAARNGHLRILDWFKNNHYSFEYFNHAMCTAAANHQPAVLDWFVKHGYPLKSIHRLTHRANVSYPFVFLAWFKKILTSIRLYLQNLLMF